MFLGANFGGVGSTGLGPITNTPTQIYLELTHFFPGGWEMRASLGHNLGCLKPRGSFLRPADEEASGICEAGIESLRLRNSCLLGSIGRTRRRANVTASPTRTTRNAKGGETEKNPHTHQSFCPLNHICDNLVNMTSTSYRSR